MFVLERRWSKLPAHAVKLPFSPQFLPFFGLFPWSSFFLMDAWISFAFTSTSWRNSRAECTRCERLAVCLKDFATPELLHDNGELAT